MKLALLLTTCMGLLLAFPKPGQAAAEYNRWSALVDTDERGDWGLDLRGGWPRFAARGQVGIGGGWSPTVEFVGTPSWRVEPSIGLSKSLLKSPRGRLVVELLGGWQFQTGSLAQRGPSLVARVRPLLSGKRVGLWLSLGTRHTLLFDRTTRRSIQESKVTWSARHRWSPEVGLGVVVRLAPRFSLTFGLDWAFVDVGTIALSLPGLQAGVQFSGGRR